MKIIRIVSIIILTVICILLIIKLYFRINLPYENERYFDENNFVVYHLQEIIFYVISLILCTLLVIFFLILNRKK
jgi:hypothetical protein